MKNKLLYLIFIFVFLFSNFVIADTEYNFLSSTQVYSSPTNNSYIFIGNDNNTWLMFGDMNGTVREIFIGNYTNVRNITGFHANCNFSTIQTGVAANNAIIYKFNDNTTYCSSGSGTAYSFNADGSSAATPTVANNSFQGFTLSGTGATYRYDNGGNPFAFNKKIMPNLAAWPALACYSQLNTAFINNFGINLTANGGLNQSYNSGTLIQHNLSLFYFKVDDRWFYFEEGNENTCANIANTLQEATLNFPNDTSTTSNRLTIINDELFRVGKIANTLYLFTSEEVDIYNGLACNNGTCINATGYCVLPPFGPDLTYFCTNVSITINGQPYCNGVIYQTYCSDSCENTELINPYNVPYDTGVCLNDLNCTNECNTLGESYSDSSSSYKYCTLSNITGCLIYSGSIDCASGESSINGECINTTYSGGVGTLAGWSTSPYVYNLTGLTYTLTGLKSIKLWSVNNFINLKFYTASMSTPYYLVRWCNYTSSTILDLPTVNTDYNNTDYVVTPNGYTNGISELGILPASDTGILLQGVDSLNRESFKYYVYRNSTLGVCVYYPNTTNNMSQLLGCVNLASDNLYNIVASVQTYENTNTIKLDVYTGLTTFTTYYGTLITKTNPASLTITKFNYSIQSGNVKSIKISNDIQNSNINVKLVNLTDDYGSNPCYITSTGCRTVRTYYMNYASNNWNLYNYKDWEVCVMGLGEDVIEADTENGIFSGWTKRQKILFGLGTSVMLLMVLLIIAMIQSFDDEKRPLIWVAIFVFIASLIFFAVIEWIPIWMLIVPAILASLGVGIFFISKTGGQ